MKLFKKIGAEAILAIIIAPFIAWFLTFVISTYVAMAEISNNKEDLKEIKQDVKDIKSFLITNGEKNGTRI
jgi:energy-converting hydrogenase Eha subunit B